MDYIIHAASPASPKHYNLDPVGTIDANVIGTKNLLELARGHRVKGFLFISSGEVYGAVSDDEVPTKEEQYGYLDICSVRSCYAESKRLGETMCVAYFHQHSVPVKIIRPSHTYGPGVRLDDGRVFADFINNIVHNQNIKMTSDGSAVRSFCYITDAVRAFFTVLLMGKPGESYNLGNEECEISIKDLANLLVSLFPEKKLSVIQKEQDKDNKYMKSPVVKNSHDTQKLRSLGWMPEVGLVEGFQRTVKSFG